MYPKPNPVVDFRHPAKREEAKQPKIHYRAKKRFGQNFLKNLFVVKKIVKALDLSPEDVVVEIGPGTGVLTEELLKTGTKVIAVEKDRDLIPVLKEKFKDFLNLTIINQDILDFNPTFDIRHPTSGLKVCGNLPYYLSGKILEIVLESWRPKSKLAVFMLQKEVCQKLVAKPPDMTVLSVINRFLADFKILFSVSRNNFSPQPKVDSAVIKITPKKENIFAREPKLKNFVKSGFAYPRKYLIASLADKLNLEKNSLKRHFEKLGISEKARPGELSLESWFELYKKIFS